MAAFEAGALDALRSDRLLLTRPTRDDRVDFRRMNSDEKVMATLGGVMTLEASDDKLDRLIGHWDAHYFGYWIARDLDSGEFAGRGGLRHIVMGGEPVIELGYGFRTEYWGRGLATELAAFVVRVGFEQIGSDSLVCFTTFDNLKSQSVMEKVGFVHTGEFTHEGYRMRLCRLDADRWRHELAGAG